MGMDNVPADWGSYYQVCDRCNKEYHLSAPECDCHPCNAEWNPSCDNIVVGDQIACDHCEEHKGEEWVVCMGHLDFVLKSDTTLDEHNEPYCSDCMSSEVTVVEVEEYEETNDAMDKLSEAMNPVGGE